MKSIETCLSKYGYKYANQSDSVKEKIRNTFNENKDKKLKKIKEKIKNTNMEKYGKISNVEGNLRNGGKSHGEDQIFDDGYRQKRHGTLP